MHDEPHVPSHAALARILVALGLIAEVWPKGEREQIVREIARRRLVFLLLRFCIGCANHHAGKDNRTENSLSNDMISDILAQNY